MLDTARFRIDQAPRADLLAGWAYRRAPARKGGQREAYWKEIEGPSHASIRMTYYPQDLLLRPEPLTLVEASLPNVVFGNNHEILVDPMEGVASLGPCVGPFFDRPVDLGRAELDRVDLACNHGVGEQVTDYINQLFKLEYPGRKTKPFYPTCGVQYYSKAATLIFYDKEEESGLEAAHGILREEASFVTKRSVRRALGRPRDAARIADFTPSVVEAILKRENEKLGLNDTVLADPKATIRILIEKRGIKQGLRIYGYLSALDVMTDNEMKKLGVSGQTLWRNKKQIKEAGLWRTAGKLEGALPPLAVSLAN